MGKYGNGGYAGAAKWPKNPSRNRVDSPTKVDDKGIKIATMSTWFAQFHVKCKAVTFFLYEGNADG